MIVFCEECGERYILEQEMDPAEELVFKCTKCNEPVRVAPPAQSTQRVET